MEISEVERARRRLARAKKPKNETAAQSFRLGEAHLDKLRKLAERQDISQADLVRGLLDAEWDRVIAARKRKAN